MYLRIMVLPQSHILCAAENESYQYWCKIFEETQILILELTLVFYINEKMLIPIFIEQQ